MRSWNERISGGRTVHPTNWEGEKTQHTRCLVTHLEEIDRQTQKQTRRGVVTCVSCQLKCTVVGDSAILLNRQIYYSAVI